MENNQHKDFDNFFENKLNDRQFEFQDDFWDEMETLLPKNDTDVATAGNSRRRFVWGILWLCLIGFTGWLVYPKEKTDNSITNVHLDFNDNDNFNEEISNATLNINSSTILNVNSNSESSRKDIENGTLVKDGKENLSSGKNFKSPTNVKPNGNPNLSKNIRVEFEQGDLTTKGKVGEEELNSSRGFGINNNLNGGNDQYASPSLPKIFGNNKSKNGFENNINKIGKEDAPKLKLLMTKPMALDEKILKRNIRQTEPSCDGCPLRPSFHSLKIGLSTGLSVSQGFKNAADFTAKPSFDPTIGLRLSYLHSPISDWSINTEILYWSRSSLNAQIGYDLIAYGFGVTTVSKTINIEELHYITVPVYTVYKKDKHQFMGGFSANYLLNAHSTTQGIATAMNYNAIELRDEPSTQQWGYTKAFNRLDIGLSLGYDYQVAKGWKIGTRINYGLMDVAKDDVFGRKSFDNNLNIKVLLTCDLKELSF
jgi:hypothetical protein